ncbi:peptidoglycan DD-metalloendopeptidase family protein [Cellulomonas sp. ACRRI]|uniref:M23 family metallopeptidase n=1 Tax=Cellulomonas sp. ACRRI TaxID=2918188 RepID=UPI001EF2EA0F|nr:M23 family metallopeptidase [Cellulomonas sp. ACRRI]MCG7284690.1 peptidoglycan DD-metalloendopeptidase family protein [Cellulomonas sp. ACRRI]
MLLPAGPAAGDTTDDQARAAQQRAEAAQRQYEDAQESVEDLSAELAQAVLTLEETKARLPAAQAALDEATRTADAARRQATLARTRLEDASDVRASLVAQIEQDSTRTAEVRATVAELARAAYQGRSRSSGLEIAVGASSVEDFQARSFTASTAQRMQARTLEELTELEAAGRSNESRLQSVVETLDELEQEAERDARAADDALAAQREQNAALDRAVADQTAAAQRIEGMKGQAEAEQAAADAARADADAEIARIAVQQEAEAAAAAAARPAPANPAPPQPAAPGKPGPAAPPAAPPAPPAVESGALFSNPTSIQPMYVTSNYGMRLHPILGYTRLHAGIDLRTYCNTPLYAPRDGTVQWAEWRNGFGNQVMLNYGTISGQSLMSSSNHLTRSVVRAGQSVTRGQLIGYSGNTGLSGACHLHFEVYVGGKTVDPAPLLGLR